MLHLLMDLVDASVTATDGDLGKVRNFLFDDQSWAIRYLVSDVGSWVKRRDVVISLEAMDQLNWGDKILHFRLTKEQVRNSPDVDSKKPVSRQQEIALREYYGWPAYWRNLGDADYASIPVAAGRDFPVKSGEDTHLRSAEDVAGYQVWATDGEIGRLENFVVDESCRRIDYLDVRSGDWLHGRSMLVPTQWVSAVSWGNHRIELDHLRKQI
jgi:PRC-barrel domain